MAIWECKPRTYHHQYALTFVFPVEVNDACDYSGICDLVEVNVVLLDQRNCTQ